MSAEKHCYSEESEQVRLAVNFYSGHPSFTQKKKSSPMRSGRPRETKDLGEECMYEVELRSFLRTLPRTSRCRVHYAVGCKELCKREK